MAVRIQTARRGRRSLLLPIAALVAMLGGPALAQSADEVKTTTTYQTGSPGVGSNLLPVSVTVASGDGALAATTTTTYDVVGNVRTVDGPLPGTVDLTWWTYDALRRPVGSIGPDPDVTGALGYPATRTTYDASGQITRVERGETTGQSDAAFAAFSSLSRTDTAWDSAGRKVRDSQYIGSGLVGVTDYAYDAASRPLCTAVRMNPAAFGSLPGACALSATGTDGPDRITRNTYDNAGRLTVVQNAYGTPLVQATQTQAWTPNGKVDWIEDANGNRSDYTYDGFDRLLRLNFPSPALGAHAANANDFEQYGYDANDNLVSKLLRNPAAPSSAPSLTFTYDALNRETVKATSGTGGTADDVFSTYDNLGRRLSARFDSPTSSNAVVWTWDALGRQLTETSYGRTLTSQYDLAGRRTRLYWPGTDYIEFVYDRADRIIQLRENGVYTGAQLLNFYVYDSLGRRDYLARGNGATTDWSYVANSRDWSMTHNLAGTGQDLIQAFAINPAGQVRQRNLSNSVYSYVQPTVAQTYARDGLNRYTSVAGAAFGYDGRGNLTADGARNYTYDLENRLTAISGASGMTLSYDPLGRLRQTVSGGTTTQFLYDGDRLVAEYDGAGTLTARYAHGPGPDEPLVWYEGSTLTDRRWLHTDAQGSIIATTGSTGAILGQPYRYSPYGEPDTDYGFSGGSRFRYTGQITLRGAPLWHYKARAYDPGLGRFLQTDPVGYEDQMNLYAYVGNDPVNGVDPTGMIACPAEAKAAGTCIDSTNYNPERDGTTDVLSNPQIDASAAANMPSLATSGENEKFANFFETDAGVEFREAPGRTRDTQTGLLGTMTVPAGADASGHSHPDHAQGQGIQPSPEDRNHLDRGRPNYIYNEGRVIVLEQSGGQYQVRIISGSLNGSERRDIVNALNVIQRDARRR